MGVVYKTTPTKSATVVGVNKSYGCYKAKVWVYVRLKYMSYYMNAMLRKAWSSGMHLFILGHTHTGLWGPVMPKLRFAMNVLVIGVIWSVPHLESPSSAHIGHCDTHRTCGS